MSSLPMRLPPRLLAVVGFVAVGMLALVVAGLLDWIVGVLFLTMEFLGEILRNVFRERNDRRSHSSRRRHRSPSTDVEHRRKPGRRRCLPRRMWAESDETRLPQAVTETPPFRVLLPLGVYEPSLVDFALEECRVRHAELLLLFLRPMAVIPMGPNPLPDLSEDGEARETFDRVRSDAERAGISVRTIYSATNDRPWSIGEVAVAEGADVVVVGARRTGFVARYLRRDPTPDLLRLLPPRTSLLIHAS